ncbi:MAG: hypothetical protein WA432_04845 [Candidatus Babeliaceae bacterium]
MISSAVFFHILNVGILGYFLIIMIKKYVMPGLVQEKEAKDLLAQQWQKKFHDLQAQEALVIHETAAQEQVYTQLEEKVKMWRDAVEQKQDTQKLVAHALQEKLHEKRALQQTHFNDEQAYKILMPAVIKQSEKELKQLLTPERAKAYIERVVDHLKKG